MPLTKWFITLIIVHIIDQNTTIRTTIECNTQGLETFLACCIPNLVIKYEQKVYCTLRMYITCIVTNLSSTMTSFVRKSAPMVALYWPLNLLLTYWFIKEVLPTLVNHQLVSNVTCNKTTSLPTISQYNNLQEIKPN